MMDDYHENDIESDYDDGVLCGKVMVLSVSRS